MTACPAGHASTSTDYCDVCGAPMPAGSPAAPVPADQSSAAVSPVGLACPNCQVDNLPDALFCEECGYDFTTGTLPRPAEYETPTNEQPAVGADGLPLDQPAGTDVPAAAGTGAGGADAAAVPESGAPAVVAGQGSAVGNGSVPAAEDRAGGRPAPTANWVAELWVDPDWYRTQNSPDPLPSPGLPEIVLLRGASVLVGRASTSRNIHPEIDCGNDSGVSRRHAQLSTDGRRWWVEDLQSSNGTFVAPSSGPLPQDPIMPGERTELDNDDRVYVGGWTRIVIRPATDEEKVAS